MQTWMAIPGLIVAAGLLDWVVCFTVDNWPRPTHAVGYLIPGARAAVWAWREINHTQHSQH